MNEGPSTGHHLRPALRPWLPGHPPLATCAPLPHLPASPIPLVRAPDADSGRAKISCTWDVGGGGLESWGAQVLGDYSGRTPHSPTHRDQAGNQGAKGLSGGRLRACNPCQAGKRVPTRCKGRVFRHSTTKQNGRPRLCDLDSPWRSVLCAGQQGGRVCVSQAANSSQPGRNGHLLCF